MHKLLMAIMFAGAISANATPTWTAPEHIKEIWVAAGTTPIVTIRLLEDGKYCSFPLTDPGMDQILKQAQTAFAANSTVKAYIDYNVPGNGSWNTGATAPYPTTVGYTNVLYSLSITR